MIGTTLSHYTIEARLGKGGMGEVYQARDTRLGRDVAIKVLSAPEAGSDSVRRFMTEARAASGLNHPNIVTVHDIDQEGAIHYIVMEKIEGQPLSAVTGVPLELARFLDIAVQMTSALGAAHAAGIVHRDIKPANVMLSSSGALKVVDFGLARLLRMQAETSPEGSTSEWENSLTRPGTTLGTIGYMSPEQAQGRPVDARSDVFSVGVVFYELLSGKLAFRRDTPIGTVAAIISESLPPLRTIRRDVPRALEALVDRCLAKDAEDRYADAGEIHRALVAIRGGMSRPERSARTRWLFVACITAVVALAAVGAYLWRKQTQLRWARTVAVSEIDRLLESEDPIRAYLLARRALEIAPDDSQVQQAWASLTMPVTLESKPAGAEVSIGSYKNPRDWVMLGRTPLSVRVPYPLLRYRVAHDGYVTTETAPEFDSPRSSFTLHRSGEIPAGMVFVRGGPAQFIGSTAEVPDFWIDVHEVTNADYRKFVDAGGYSRPEFWKHPFERDDRPLGRETAMRELVDQTGRPGPAGWELGAPPEGKQKHPVEGISWYEAAAYAEFVGKRLPTAFHWKRAAANEGVASDVVTASNFGGKQTVPVGSLGAIGHWGTFDMAGNVKEWCWNEVEGNRYTLGGSWLDTSYFYAQEDAQPPMARRAGYGVRLVRDVSPLAPELTREIRAPDYEVPRPVDDTAFAAFARLFDYDPAPLNATVDQVDDSHDLWTKEKVSFDAAYGGERIPAYVFLPKNAKPPYQAIVYFPGSDATMMKSSRHLWMRGVDFYIRSGRAVIFPVYKGTYERGVPPARGHNDRRELLVQRSKDVRRAVDYLASRKDIDRERIAFYGLSLGGSVGSFALPFEPRFRTAVMFGTGLYRLQRPPELQRESYLPRINLPVLLIAGRYDFGLPVETAQKPYFELLGTPLERKKHVVFEGGHVPTQFNEAVREMLSWTDRWMGPVAMR